MHGAGGDVLFGQPGAILGDLSTSFRFGGEGWSGVAGPAFPRSGRASFSLEAWVKPQLTDTTSRRIFSQENEMGGYLLGLKASGLVFARYLTEGRFRRTTPEGQEHFSQRADWDVARSVPLSAMSWHHVVATYDGEALRVYADGAILATEPSALSVEAGLGAPFNRAFAIGSRSDGWVGFNGWIDEAASYERDLTPAQVLDHYETGTSG